MECPLCKSSKRYTTFKDSKSNAIINVCNECYLIYQQQNNNTDYYNIKCSTTKVLDEDKHSRDVADYIFNFSKEFLNKTRSILEIGASSSSTLNYLNNYFNTKNLKLCGLNLPVLKTKNKHPHIKMVYNNYIDKEKGVKVKKSITNAPFKQNFNYDFIYCRHTLEHFQNPLKAVENTHNLLSNKGVAFFEVPSFLWTEVNKVPTYDIEHLTYFTKETLSHLFIKSGFTILKIKESKYWGNIKILVKKRQKNKPQQEIKIKNSIKIKKLTQFLQPIFILLKNTFNIKPNA